jgi:disulfide bond formation protein DsbB
MRRSTVLLAGSAVAAVAGVAGALVSQHVFGMLPCPWCVLQRLSFLVFAALVGIGLAWGSPTGRRFTAAVGRLTAASGVAAAGWLYFVAASSTSCNLSLAERIIGALGLDARWPDVFMAMTSCADSTASLLGISYPLWSLALFLMLAAVCAFVLRRPD